MEPNHNESADPKEIENPETGKKWGRFWLWFLLPGVLSFLATFDRSLVTLGFMPLIGIICSLKAALCISRGVKAALVTVLLLGLQAGLAFAGCALAFSDKKIRGF
jgi:hypothetical protein